MRTIMASLTATKLSNRKSDMLQKHRKNVSSFRAIVTMVALLGFWVSTAATTLAAVQDTDLDSLTDESESSVYGTDPALFDTDGDGIGDGEEILDSTNPLDPSSSHLGTLQPSDPGILGDPEKRAWYLGRATGIVAFILFALVIIHGLIMTGRVWSKIFSMATIDAIHEYLSIAALSVAVLHMASFFFDNFLRIRLAEALIPFYLERSFQTAIGADIGAAVAFGIIALYLGAILVFTSLYRSKIPLRVWRGIHYSSFAFYLLILLHGIAAGTDSQNLWMRILYLSSLFIIVSLTVLRIVVAVRMKRKIALIKAQAAAKASPNGSPTV